MLFWSIIIAFPLLFLAFHFIPKLPNLKSSPKATSGVSLATKWSIIAAFAALILARFFIATTVNGYQIDFGWATNWCLNMTSLPPWEVYKSGFFVNYQPFGLIIYGLTGLLGKILGTLPLLPEGTTAFWPWFFFSGMPSYENTYTPLIIFHWGWVLTFKSFPLLADIGLAFIAYRLGKKYSSEKIGLIVAALMLICPAMMVDSAIWGQLDSVLTFFIVLSIIFLARVAEKGETKDWILASVIFTLAILIKPQAIFFVPLFFAVLIKRWKDWKNILIAIGAILATIIVVCLPFYDARFSNEAKQMGLDNFWVFGWIIDKIQGTAGQYQKYSNHAFNIYSLLGLSGDLPMVEVIKNGVPTKELKPFWNFYKVLIPAIITFATAWVFHKSAPKSSKKGAPNSSPL
ncbi:MAG: glycosyltransferase family 39 protein, partial [Oscillospiraceae bacterium]|nr:glycosyltransferase family 39 protein [Oscillospiraceae bacterium]